MNENLINMPPAAEPISGSELMRRRYQKGTVEIHNNQWTLRYLQDVYEGAEIKRKNRRVYLGGSPPKMTEKMARRLAEPIMAEMNSTSKPKMAATLGEFIARWEPLCMPKTNSAINFKTHINKYLKPAFGNRQLNDIQTEDIQRFVVQVQTGAPNKHNILKSFRTIWKSAKAWGYVRHNPFEDIILPTMAKSEQRYFTEAELCRILSMAPEPDKTMYWLLAQTGLRIGEVLGLTWETVDLENSIVIVQTSVARGKLRDREVKTDAAKRIIPISPRLAEHLSIYRTKLWQANDHNLLFANTAGNPWSASSFLDRRFKPFLAGLAIPDAGFHAFRHASATILSRMKVPMEIRRARMGHTDEEMTLRYTHVIDSDAREVASNFDRILSPETAISATVETAQASEIAMEVGA